jgi:hypothetical protein
LGGRYGIAKRLLDATRQPHAGTDAEAIENLTRILAAEVRATAPVTDAGLREALPTLRRALSCLRAGAYDDAADDLADLIAALSRQAEKETA